MIKIDNLLFEVAKSYSSTWIVAILLYVETAIDHEFHCSHSSDFLAFKILSGAAETWWQYAVLLMWLQPRKDSALPGVNTPNKDTILPSLDFSVHTLNKNLFLHVIHPETEQSDLPYTQQAKAIAASATGKSGSSMVIAVVWEVVKNLIAFRMTSMPAWSLLGT